MPIHVSRSNYTVIIDCKFRFVINREILLNFTIHTDNVIQSNIWCASHACCVLPVAFSMSSSAGFLVQSLLIVQY